MITFDDTTLEGIREQFRTAYKFVIIHRKNDQPEVLKLILNALLKLTSCKPNVYEIYLYTIDVYKANSQLSINNVKF